MIDMNFSSSHLMHKRIISRLILLPIALLVCLSCPIKHQMKVFLNIPVNNTDQTDNYKSSRTCLVAFSNKGTSQQHKFSADHCFLHSQPLMVLSGAEGLSPRLYSFPGNTSENVPFFLLFRKIII